MPRAVTEVVEGIEAIEGVGELATTGVEELATVRVSRHRRTIILRKHYE
jgi:hypothetical protein